MRHSGFTMLELLIVGVLTSVLMLGVWSLFRTWGRLYERGTLRVEAAQLERSLCDQFSDDVRAVVYVAPAVTSGFSSRGAGSGSGSSRSGRRTARDSGGPGLVGGATWMVLDVLTPPSPYAYPAAESADSSLAEQAGLYAPELQRVVYTFEPPAEEGLDSLSPAVAEMAALDDTELVGVGAADEELVEPFSGLLRLVVAVEQYEALVAPSSGQSAAVRSPQWQDAVAQLRVLAVGEAGEVVGAGGAGGVAGATAATSWDTAGAAPALSPGGGIVSQDEVPEVIWFELRYFDGRQWLSSWDSRAAGRLPVAVEMRFELREQDLESDAVDSSEETELVESELPETDSLADFLPAESNELMMDETDLAVAGQVPEEVPYVRCVVFLEPAADER